MRMTLDSRLSGSQAEGRERTAATCTNATKGQMWPDVPEEFSIPNAS